MAKVTLPISNGFYVSDSLALSNQRCVNFIPSIPQTDTITQDNLFFTPGLIEIVSTGVNKITRGAHEMAGIPYFVIGNNLYRLNLSIVDNVEIFDFDDLGEIVGSERVYMSDNGTQLCIVAIPDGITAGKSYIFTDNPDTLAEITDANFDGPASSVEYINGYFTFTKSDGKKFFNSPLNDGLGVYDPLDFSTAEVDPDQLRAQISYNNALYMIGSQTTQQFRDVGRSPSPFSPTPAVIDVGITSPQSLKLFAGSFVFVGAGALEKPSVWLIDGLTRKKISTIAIDRQLDKLTQKELEDVFAWTEARGGAFFYGITLPKNCFVYDATNRRWHERQSSKVTTYDNTEITQYRVSATVQAYGRVFVGDLQDGRIGVLSDDETLEYGRLITRFVTSRPFDNQGRAVSVSKIEAVVDAGVGLTNDINVVTNNTSNGLPITGIGGSDPQITLSWSDDGGHIFVGNRSRSLGKTGDHKRRPIWLRLGQFPRSRVLKFEIAAPVKSAILKIEANIT